MPIHLYGARIWEEPVKKVTDFDEKLVGLMRDMFNTMHESGGIGLAANQVGVPLMLAVIDLSTMSDYANEAPVVVINPEILSLSENAEVMEESCLSIPGVKVEVPRPQSIVARFTDGKFQTVEVEYSGLMARVFQHEYDHLHQKFIVDYVPKVKRQVLKPKLSKIKRGDVSSNYTVISARDEKKMKSLVNSISKFGLSNPWGI